MQALRATVYLLVLGNLLLFAYGQNYFGPADGAGESGRLTAQIEPEKIRIVGKGAAPKSNEIPAEACRALAGLPQEPAQRLAELLLGRDAQLKVSRRAQPEAASWWVFIPPQANKQQAEKKAAELKKFSIDEFFVVQERGPNQFAISLGLFKSEEGAREYLGLLAGKGVRSARIQAREAAGDKMIVEARGLPERLNKAFADLPAEFAAAAAAECAVAK
jgi:hypothetical protein